MNLYNILAGVAGGVMLLGLLAPYFGQAGQVLSRQELLAQWPKGFTHVELSAGLAYVLIRAGWNRQKPVLSSPRAA